MRVLTIAPIPFFVDRGGAIRVYEELKELKRQGVENRVVAYHLGRDLEGLDISRIPNIPFYRKEGVGGSYQRLYLDLLLFLKALRIAKRFRPDIIHGHLHEGAMIGIMLRGLLKIPVLMDAQGSLTREMTEKGFVGQGSLMHALFRKLEGFVCRHSDFIVVSSRNLKNMIAESFHARRIEYISDGVNADFFSPGKRSKAFLDRYGLAGKSVVVFTGVLTKFQGVDLLLQSVPGIVRECKGVKFLIVGFPDVDRYRRMAHDLGISDHVVFTGKLNYFDMPDVLRNSDIAVSPKVPTVGEANLKLYTYMAAGLPSVVLDTEENRQTLGESGVFCKNTPESFAEGILALLKDRGMAKRKGREAREMAKSYAWAKTIQNLLRVYQKVISEYRVSDSSHFEAEETQYGCQEKDAVHRAYPEKQANHVQNSKYRGQ